jgi:molecular chaperone GrpE
MKKTQDQEKYIIELHNQIAEIKAKYLRALADYQNLEKRTAENTERVRRFAAETLICRLLSVLDNMEKAESHLKDPGLSLAVKEFRTVLTQNGLAKILTSDRDFDPNEMECIEVTEGKENRVIEESLPGYRLHGKVIRPARVKVGKNNTDKN